MVTCIDTVSTKPARCYVSLSIQNNAGGQIHSLGVHLPVKHWPVETAIKMKHDSFRLISASILLLGLTVKLRRD